MAIRKTCFNIRRKSAKGTVEKQPPQIDTRDHQKTRYRCWWYGKDSARGTQGEGAMHGIRSDRSVDEVSTPNAPSLDHVPPLPNMHDIHRLSENENVTNRTRKAAIRAERAI